MSDGERFEVRMKAQGPVLAAYHRSRARVSIIRGPLGSGKTIQTCQKIFALMCEQSPNAEGVRPSRWYAVRNTFPDLMTTTIKDWLGLFGELGRFTQGSKEPPNWTAEFDLDDGTKVRTELVFLALDRDDHVKKLRGAQTTGFWLNEAKELPKSIIDMADLRHGRYPSRATGGVQPSWHGMLGDTNSPDDLHWLYRLAEEDRPDGWEFFSQPGGVIRVPGKKTPLGGQLWAENPKAENIKNLPAEYYLKGMAGKSDDWIAVNLANEYGVVIEGKPVYPEYHDEVHCPEEGVPFRPDLPIALGWDFGLTPCLIVAQLTPRGQLRIIDELVSEDMGVYQFARDAAKPFLAKYLKHQAVGLSMCDPAGGIRHETDASYSIAVLNDESNDEDIQRMPLDLGFVTEGSPSNAPASRQGAVKHYLTKMVDGQPGLLVDRRCKVVRRGFMGGYRYRKLATVSDRYAESPEKNAFSHPHDALQYVSQGALAGMISDGTKEPDDAPPEPVGWMA